MPSLFQSISSFFSAPKDGSHIRRDQAMLSVDDAFTVPPDAEYVSSPTVYTYPPPAQGGSYDTVPQSSYAYDLRPPHSAGSSTGTRSRPNSLLPLHHSPLSPLPHYPPLQQTWNRLRAWLEEAYPELADTLNWGIEAPELAHLELQLGFALPPAVRESYLVVDGQEAESSAGCSEGLFFGLTLLPFEDVVDEWRFWREVDDDPATGGNAELRENMRSIPPGWIRKEYSQRGWLPLIADKGGNYLGVDMNPDEAGAVGQVIVFGRDFDTKVVMWRGDGEAGWARWLASFVEELEGGEGFELGVGDGSEGSEDDVGYESYFFDGSGRGKGQGGAEGGSGGLRLTGEYRGWPVLEALADRSMKRWIEAGVMPQPMPSDERVSSSNAVELGLDAAVSDPEVPVPAVRVSSEGRSTPTAQINGDPGSLHSKLPSLSINKVPAPLPVALPTEDDLLPSPTYSPTETTLVYDEEAARLPMREVDRTTPVQTNFGPPAVKEANLVPLPSSDASSPSNYTNPAPGLPEPLSRQATDPISTESEALLVDSAPNELLSVSSVEPTDAPEPALSSDILTPTPIDSSDPTPPEPDALTEEPQPSVRLVGGGGVSGDASLVDGDLEDDTTSDSSKKNALDNVSGGSSGKRKKEVV